MVRWNYADLKKDLENIKSNHVNYPLKKNRKEISTIVLLIGESVQPKHMQLYGYERKNTPVLENGELDLESLNCVDVTLFNKHLNKL